MIEALALAAALFSGAPRGAAAAGLRWERSFDEAQKKARAAHKPLMVDFWADWCSWCHRLDHTTYVDPRVVQLAQGFIPVKVNTEGDTREAAIALRYEVGSLPTIAFVSPAGRMILRVSGYQGPGQFPLTLAQAQDLATRVMGWEAALERNPEDAATLMALGVHLFDQESFAESRALLAKAIRFDAERPAQDRKQSRMLVALILKTYDRKYPEAEALLREGLAIKPPSDEDPKLLWVLGRTYLAWGKQPEARAVLQEIVTAYAESPVAQKARETLIALDRR